MSQAAGVGKFHWACLLGLGGFYELRITGGQCGSQIAGVEERVRDEQGEFTNGLVGICRTMPHLVSLSEELRQCHLLY